MRLYKAVDRKQLYFRIYIYLQRRDKIREKYGVVNGGKASLEYKRAARKINSKLATWRKQITMIDNRNNRIIAIANNVAYFTGINVRLDISNTNPRNIQARNIFYKYCLENSISATLVAEYVGAGRGDTVARGRLKFTKSFEKHPENRDVYYRFKEYIENILEDIKNKDGGNEKF